METGIVTRNEFITGCAAGMCSCAAMALFPDLAEGAQSNEQEQDRSKAALEAARIRFAKLIVVLNDNLDTATRNKVLEGLGRACAQQYSELLSRYKNNLKGFLEEGQKQWMEKAELDEQAGTLRIVDRQTTCSCPLVKVAATPAEFCACTLGWQKEAYSTILGRPVEVELEESILRGGKRCVYRIRIS